MSTLFAEYVELVENIKNGNLDKFKNILKSIKPGRMVEIKSLVPTLNRQEYGDTIPVLEKQVEYYQEKLDYNQKVLSNLMDDNGVSLLQNAVMFKRPEFVKHLLDIGADINYIAQNQSILSFLVICDINALNIPTKQWARRLEETATLIQKSKIDIKKISLMPSVIKTLVRQIEITQDQSMDFEGFNTSSFEGGANCNDMESKIRKWFPTLVLSEQESSKLKELLYVPTEEWMDDRPFYRKKQIKFSRKCREKIENIVQNDPERKIRSLKSVNMALLELKDRAEDITKDLKLLVKHETFVNYMDLIQFALQSHFLDHLKVTIKPYSEGSVLQNLTSFLFLQLSELHLLEAIQKKLELLIKNNYPILNNKINAYEDCLLYETHRAFILEPYDYLYKHKVLCLKLMEKHIESFEPIKNMFVLNIAKRLKVEDILRLPFNKIKTFSRSEFLHLCCSYVTIYLLEGFDFDLHFSLEEYLKTITYLMPYVIPTKTIDYPYYNHTYENYYHLLIVKGTARPELVKRILNLYIVTHKCTNGTSKKRKLVKEFKKLKF